MERRARMLKGGAKIEYHVDVENRLMEKPLKTIVMFCLLALMWGCRADVGAEVGKKPPEINAVEWFNAGSRGVTLASLTGKVVVVEFWTTWCEYCLKAVPELVKLTSAYKDKDVVIICLTDEDSKKANVAKFVAKMKVNYIVGTGSTSGKAYGVSSIPAAFVISKRGTLVWTGTGQPMEGFEEAIKDALGGTAAGTPSAQKPAAKAGGT